MSDEYNLYRFVSAQNAVYDDAIHSLRRGRMCPDYIDFIFPRLGARDSESGTKPYAIKSTDEASAYLAFPVLGGRYRECIGTLQRLAELNARAVFGETGAKQLHASLTLFSEASDEFLFETILYAWFDSLLDDPTVDALRSLSDKQTRKTLLAMQT
jgi:uncharacterized protein (DUF1810 family)